MMRACVRKSYMVALVISLAGVFFGVWYRLVVERGRWGSGIGLVGLAVFLAAQLVLNWEYEVVFECCRLRDERIEECLRRRGIDVASEPGPGLEIEEECE